MVFLFGKQVERPGFSKKLHQSCIFTWNLAAQTGASHFNYLVGKARGPSSLLFAHIQAIRIHALTYFSKDIYVPCMWCAPRILRSLGRRYAMLAADDLHAMGDASAGDAPAASGLPVT